MSECRFCRRTPGRVPPSWEEHPFLFGLVSGGYPEPDRLRRPLGPAKFVFSRRKPITDFRCSASMSQKRLVGAGTHKNGVRQPFRAEQFSWIPPVVWGNGV